MKLSNVNRFTAILLLVLFTFASCDKDDPEISEEEQEEMNEDPANSTGRFSDHLTCNVINVPPEVGLNSYYKKYINCSGVPVISSAAVSDEALVLASETVEFMLTDLGNVRAKLIEDGNYVAIYPEGGSLSDLPENFTGGPNSTGAYSNGPSLKALATDAASLLCNPEVGYGHTLVHEMAHMIDGGAMRFIDNTFTATQTSIYNQAIASGKWANTYAASNPREYLAEGVTIWYGVNWIGPEGGDGNRNNVGTRAELQAYDPNLYNFINTYYNNSTDVPGCRTPVISGTSASCPDTVTDIDGNVYNVVNIGPMCWMKENLETTKFNDGTPIQNITDNTAWQNTTSPAWSTYDNDGSNGDLYGHLYNGYALNSTKQLCPTGWHVPSYQELQDLVNYAGGDYASVDLRTTALWNPPGLPATNSSNFTALPSGIRNQEGFFQEAERRTNFGSRTTSNSNTANFYSKAIFGDQERIYTDNVKKTLGMPCRCIKD
tara:strand:+ start:46325 stop:47791 length:1467 start_codon:yes stop_codon:yes gene_type:complete